MKTNTEYSGRNEAESAGYYTADPDEHCVICGKSAAQNAQLIRTHAGYKCGSGCRPHRASPDQAASPTPDPGKKPKRAESRKTRVGW